MTDDRAASAVRGHVVAACLGAGRPVGDDRARDLVVAAMSDNPTGQDVPDEGAALPRALAQAAGLVAQGYDPNRIYVNPTTGDVVGISAPLTARPPARSLVDVIDQHTQSGAEGLVSCWCGERFDSFREHAEHLAQLIEGAGPVAAPTRWWRVIYADGRCYPETRPDTGEPHLLAGRPQIWCETSNEAEARAALADCPGGGVLQRLYERTDSEWRAEP